MSKFAHEQLLTCLGRAKHVQITHSGYPPCTHLPIALFVHTVLAVSRTMLNMSSVLLTPNGLCCSVFSQKWHHTLPQQPLTWKTKNKYYETANYYRRAQGYSWSENTTGVFSTRLPMNKTRFTKSANSLVIHMFRCEHSHETVKSDLVDAIA